MNGCGMVEPLWVPTLSGIGGTPRRIHHAASLVTPRKVPSHFPGIIAKSRSGSGSLKFGIHLSASTIRRYMAPRTVLQWGPSIAGNSRDSGSVSGTQAASAADRATRRSASSRRSPARLPPRGVGPRSKAQVVAFSAGTATFRLHIGSEQDNATRRSQWSHATGRALKTSATVHYG